MIIVIAEALPRLSSVHFHGFRRRVKEFSFVFREVENQRFVRRETKHLAGRRSFKKPCFLMHADKYPMRSFWKQLYRQFGVILPRQTISKPLTTSARTVYSELKKITIA